MYLPFSAVALYKITNVEAVFATFPAVALYKVTHVEAVFATFPAVAHTIRISEAVHLPLSD